MNGRQRALAGVPVAFAGGAVAARLWIAHAPQALARDLAQPLPVVTAWGSYGVFAFALLAGAIVWSALATIAAWRTTGVVPAPGIVTAVLLTAALSLAACLAWPFVFSSDVYAYAAYGDMMLRGLDPYRLVPPGAHDAFIDAARGQWSGTFPVCVYGPLFVTFARLTVWAAGSHGVAATLLLLRVAACAAFLASVALLHAALAHLPAPRRFAALCAYGLNPVVLWSAAEGHNDAYVMLAAGAAALLLQRGRGLCAVFMLALTPVVKASGTVLALAAALEAAVFWRLGSARALLAFGAGTALATGIALPPLLPALTSVGTYGRYEPASLQGVVGLWPAAMLAATAGTFAVTEFFRRRRDGFAWLGIAAFVALPNVYPWYSLWLTPLAVAAGGGFAAAALWGATISSILRYLPDASGQLTGDAVRLAAALGALPLALALAQFADFGKKAPLRS